ncbi:YggT family protein [Schaalia sp. 19OD2882]|uniref:YggT family protein n=1 Tax=Schaalia sp. 19OD2882 TaxID=2794089 RepID=UPI001C1ECE0D|nr:YggT family protein [Schaalia sp. 19OD2882]QWW18935.1 YggT family protein [Schaalia sp. 19OD2882]
MFLISWVGLAISLVAGLYMLVLIARMVLDWVRFFSPSFRPQGLALPLANACYTLTDPPLLALRRIIPPLRLGQGFALDVGFIVLVLGVMVVQNVGTWLQRWGASLG